jgi:hypothetical protein
MPPSWVYEGIDGVLMLYNGVTRATRIATLAPGTLIRVEVIGRLPRAFGSEPRCGGPPAMKSDAQGEILDVLAEIWTLSPDVRVGQLMAHLGFLGEVQVGHGLGDIDDDELLAVMYRHRKELSARLEGGSDMPLQLISANASVSGSPISEAPRVN